MWHTVKIRVQLPINERGHPPVDDLVEDDTDPEHGEASDAIQGGWVGDSPGRAGDSPSWVGHGLVGPVTALVGPATALVGPAAP